MHLALTGSLSLRSLAEVAAGETRVELAPEALARVGASRRALEEAVRARMPIYGVTTGLGALVEADVDSSEAEAIQAGTLRSHATGWGAPLPREAVRAALIVRLNGLLRGYSGVRPVVLERIRDLLNADLLPVVPRYGSLGASGDLAPSAHAFLPLIGEGRVEDAAGRGCDGGEALARLGAEPLRLEAKEALALINGTHFMAGIGALVAVRLERALDAADAIAAASLEALRGTLAAFDPRIHALRPLEGQIRSAANVRRMLDGYRPAAGGTLQDAYSLRCIPQVHGSARAAAAFASGLVAIDVDAVTDNPLVFDEEPDVISAGNFHGQSLALALDTARAAMADLASISERRTFRLLSPSLNRDLPPFLTRTPGPSNGYMVAQYTAAALVAELKRLAHPAGVDSIPTSDNQEDHVSMGMHAATLALDAVERLEAVLAIELVCAAQALDLRGAAAGRGTARLRELVRREVPFLDADRPPAGDIEAAARLIRSGEAGAVLAALPEEAR